GLVAKLHLEIVRPCSEGEEGEHQREQGVAEGHPTIGATAAAGMQAWAAPFRHLAGSCDRRAGSHVPIEPLTPPPSIDDPGPLLRLRPLLLAGAPLRAAGVRAAA